MAAEIAGIELLYQSKSRRSRNKLQHLAHAHHTKDWYILVYTAEMTFLERVCSELNTAKVRYVVVGGYAVALHGAVRGTLDVDIALRWTRKDLTRAEAALNKIELVSRLPITAADVFNFRDEYVRNRNLLAWNFHNPSDPSEQLDIVVNFDAKGRSAVYRQLPAASVPVLNLNDLIKMKKSSGRAQDIEDVKALEKLK